MVQSRHASIHSSEYPLSKAIHAAPAPCPQSRSVRHGRFDVRYRGSVSGCDDHAARNAGFELPLSAYLETIGLPASRVRELLLARFGEDAPLEDLWRQASELFTQMVQTDLRTKAGLPEILSFLEAARIPSAIVTSSGRTAVEAHLSAAGLQGRRFQTIIAYGDYTVGKPDPAPYLLAAERLNLPISECVALEDSRNGVLSASGAGAMTIMVPDLVQPAPDIPGRCACILADLHAVRDLIAISMAGAAVEP